MTGRALNCKTQGFFSITVTLYRVPCHATMISVPVGGIEWFVVSPLCHDQSLVYFYTFFYFTLYSVLRTPTPYAHRIHGYTENRHHFGSIIPGLASHAMVQFFIKTPYSCTTINLARLSTSLSWLFVHFTPLASL